MNINTNIIKLSYNNCDYEGETFQNQPQNRGVAIFNSGNSYYGYFIIYVKFDFFIMFRRMEKRII